MFVDTHLHLNNPIYTDYKDVVRKAKAVNVTKLITIGTSINEIEIFKEITKLDNVYATLGVYPTADEEHSLEQLKSTIKNNINQKIVGIGECGFNQPLQEKDRSIEKQKEIFEMQIELAIEEKLPIVVHNRNSDTETYNSLKKYATQNLRGVIHCFVSDYEFAKKVLDLGFYLSFNGIITYKSASSIYETIKNIPIDRVLFETDAPHLSPEGYRKAPNEPKFIPLIAEKFCEIRGCKLEDIENQVYENSLTLFDKIS